ncbi:MAG: chemotaxis protein CheB [Pseudomonadota bacterium]
MKTGNSDLEAKRFEHSSEPRRSLGKVDQSFYIIGVGASAGGLDAIKQLVAHADGTFMHSFVIIQHISPDHKSLMKEILARETGMAIVEVTDDMPVAPKHIYLIPPSTNVVIQGTSDDTRPIIDRDGNFEHTGLRFSLIQPMPRPQLNLPIDVFFQSLADGVGNRAIGIVLSGTGTDGSRGLRAIKDRDGFVLVQEPATAAFDGMPIAAIATNLVDVVVPPDAMVPELNRFIDLREDGVFNIDEIFANGESDFDALIGKISERASIDFAQYKKPTLRRRIARRVVLNHCRKLKEYLKFVDRNPQEIEILHREFLIGVTNFFRDLPAWLVLRDEAFPRIFGVTESTEPVKIWSVGCSTGEEAYTTAFLLETYRRVNGIERDFRIFASDVNEDAIRAAKDGIYPSSILEEIPPEYRTSDTIVPKSGTFQISSAIRNKVIFSVHNVLQEPPYIDTDLIICRNLLIYLSPDMQKKVMSLFSFSLRSEGFLFLGAAENVTNQNSKFQAEVSSARLYSNCRSVQRGMIRSSEIGHNASFSMPRMRRLATRETQRSNSAALGPIFEAALTDIDGCILILDEVGNILETVGNYREYVKLPDQAFSANALDLVHDRLKSTISILTRQAGAEGHANALNVKCAFSDRIEQVDVFCHRIEWETQPVAFSLFIRKTDTRQVPLLNGTAQEGSEFDHATLAKLENEVESLQAMLSVTTEDLGISNEELQAANEELTVSNEELQSNNEEMQSINEELHTVNAENADKIILLETAKADIENLLNTSDFAIIFLDENLGIRRFNTAVCKFIDLKPSDIGRPLSSFSSRLEIDDHARFLSDINELIDGGAPTEREIKLDDGTWVLLRVRPFDVARPSDPGGIAITIIDVTATHQLKEQVLRERDRLEGLLDSELAGYWDWNLATNEEYLSPRFKSMLGYEVHEMENRPESWQTIIDPDDLKVTLGNFEQHVATKGKHPFDQEVRYQHQTGKTVWVLCRGRVIEWAEDGAPLRMVGIHIDITDLKERELRSREPLSS